jgi:hypothetical protein
MPLISPLVSSRSQNTSLFSPSGLTGGVGPTGPDGPTGITGPAGNTANFVSGMIIAWNNVTAPAGWALCDGGSGTPDLRGRFIVGTSGVAPFTFANTGGAGTVTLVEANLPPHSHTVATHQGAGTAGGAGDSGILVGTQTSSSTGGGQAVPILPPFYVLSYIMKL